MRIRKLNIGTWRHFRDISLSLDDNANLVCLVGANGTGKSHLLELIAACAHKLGLAPGIETGRGDPFNDDHSFSLQFFLARGITEAIDNDLKDNPNFSEWDRTLTLESTRASGQYRFKIEAGGILAQSDREQFAQRVVEKLRNSEDVYFVSLDADRAYPAKNIHVNEIAQAYEIDWETQEYTRGRSFKRTTTLYDEWIKYFLARENQAGTKLIKDIRTARLAAAAEPKFSDHFEAYKEALRKILPHVVFTGVDSKARTLLFDTTGLELAFSQLSGGEREIAFLVGQIDRFGLKKGLFLLDEPELHLNADLIRSWVEYLTGTVENGQVWLATHSLEAVEAAGPESTFTLDRDEKTRTVNNIARLDSKPLISALSRAVGTAAFSLSRLAFVFIEGEEHLGERERFRKLADTPKNIRFMEGGSCTDVLRRVASIKLLAKESDMEIRIGGILDRDFRSAQEIQSYEKEAVFVLGVHEIENLFLDPTTIQVLLNQNGINDATPQSIIRDAADKRAGAWIFQYALASKLGMTLQPIAQAAKEFTKTLEWGRFLADRPATIDSIAKLSKFGSEDSAKFAKLLAVGCEAYERLRAGQDLWKGCEGKQVLNDVAKRCAFSGTPGMLTAIYGAWSSGRAAISTELAALRSYVNAL